MEEIKKDVQITNLVQRLGTYNYKLLIPTEVERKIRFTCQKIWNTEWSGTLFFTYEGSFEDDNLVIKCEDIYIMDIGNQTYTEFDMNPDVIAYMTENPKLLDCQLGLIHSHNNMSTFFSGTDQQTLKEEGIDRNNFVSLIVNNAGTYTAAITRKVKEKKVKESMSYEFFDKGETQETKEYVKEAEEIEWFNLKIEKECEDTSFSDIETRLEEIKKAKAAKVIKPISNFNNEKPVVPSQSNKYTQRTLFDDVKDPYYQKDYILPYDEIALDEDTLKSIVLQIITGSVIISNNSKLDINQWVKSMPALYERRFGKGEEGMKSFEAWAESYIEYLVWYVNDNTLTEQGFNEDDSSAIYAYNLVLELDKFPKNKYIECYLNKLEKYIL